MHAYNVYYAYDQASTLFLVVYALVTMTFAAIWLNWLFGTLGSNLWLIPVGLGHFVVGYVILLVMFRARVEW